MRGAADVHTGAMVALVPTAEDAQRLAVDGGVPADELHATLVYLGEAAAIPDQTRAAIVDQLRSLIEDAVRPDYDLPVEADGFALSVFNPDGDEPCVVLGLSGDDLDAVHDLVLETVEEAAGDLMPEQRRPWVAHVTLEYTDDAGRVEDLVDRAGPVRFDRIRVAFAGENIDLPLTPAGPMVPPPLLTPVFFEHVTVARERLVILDRTYKRDRDGQFSSGGGGGGVRESLASAGTPQDVAATAQAEAKRITGRDIEFDMEGSDAQVAREHCEGVLRGLEKYPRVELDQVVTASIQGGWAETQGGSRIVFNRKFAADPAGYRESLARSHAEGHFSVDDPTGVALHEFGHALFHPGARGLAGDALADQTARASGEMVRALVRREISGYATASGHELGAEAFAVVMTRGDKASALAHEIVAVEVGAAGTAGQPANVSPYDVIARTYKRDRDGKFSSGDGGGAVRDSLAAAGTVDEIASVVSGEASALTKGHVQVDFTGLDPAVARDYGEGILQGFEAYPATGLREVGTYSGSGTNPRSDTAIAASRSGDPTSARRTAFHTDDDVGPEHNIDVTLASGRTASVGASAIYFNVDRSTPGEFATIRRQLDQERAAGGPITGQPMAGPQAVALHEFAHAAGRVGGMGKPAPELAVREALIETATRAGTGPGKMVVDGVSKYAAENYKELSAEVFTDHMVNGDKASAVSKELFDAFDAAAAGWAQSRGMGPQNRTYKRDSKGRFGSGSGSGLGQHGPVRDELRHASSIDELNEALASGIERATGRRIPVEMAGSDLQVGREHAEGILRAVERFPDAPLAEVRVVGRPTGPRKYGDPVDPKQAQDSWDWLSMGGAMAATTEHLDGARYGQRILINRDYAGDPGKYDAALKNSGDASSFRWGQAGHLVAASPTGVAIHEMGHVVARAGRSATAGKRAAAAEAKRQGVKVSALVRSEVSHYAASSIHELAGEAFADVMVHGAAASPTSKAVFAEIASRAPGRGDVTARLVLFQLRAAQTRDRAAEAALILDRAYRRDSAGRFSSGGGSGSMHPQIAACSTTSEVEAILSTELHDITGQHVPVIMTGLSVDVARWHAEGVLRAMKQFPDTALHKVTTYGPDSALGHSTFGNGDMSHAYAVTTHVPGARGSTIYLNTKYGELDVLTETVRDSDAAHHLAGEPGDLARLASHEVGHAWANTLRPTVARTAVEDLAIDRHLSASTVKKEISGYARENATELMAESFSDVVSRGDRASQLSKDIVDAVGDEFDNGMTYPANLAPVTFLTRPDRLLDRTYHRDKDGQFASGGDAGGRGIRPALAQAGTIREIERATKSELRSVLGRGVAVSFKGLDPDVARIHAEGVLRTAELFPRTRLDGIATVGAGGDRGFDRELAGHENTHGITTTGQRSGTSTIYFNTKYATVDSIRAVAAREGSTGYYRNSDDLTMTGAHEMAHAAHGSLKPNTMTYAAARIMAHAKPGPVTGAEFVSAHIGRAATADYNELAAEAVAHVASRGTDAPAFAQEIVQQSQARWDGWEL